MDLEDAANIGFLSGIHGPVEGAPFIEAYCSQVDISQEEVSALMDRAGEKLERLAGENDGR